MTERTRSGLLGLGPVRMERTRLASVGLVAALALGGCASGSGATATPAAVPTATPAPVATAGTATPAGVATPAPATPAGPTTVAMGTFHDVDGTAMGTVFLIHLASGKFEIVFEDFSTATNAHTNVILLPVADVKTDNDVDKTAILDLGPLKASFGMQDFPLPSSADPMGYHTVVLWDTEMAHAIAAAPLK